MKTVQRSPEFDGQRRGEGAARRTRPLIGCPASRPAPRGSSRCRRRRPCSSRSRRSTPFSREMYLESCPPISKIVSTVGSMTGRGRGLGGDLVLDDVGADEVARSGSGRSRWCRRRRSPRGPPSSAADLAAGPAARPRWAGRRSSGSAWQQPAAARR